MPADRRVFLAALAAVAAAVAAATFGARFRPGGVRGRLPPAPAPLAERLIVIGDSATIGGDAFYTGLLAYFDAIGAYHTVWEEAW